MAFYIFFWLERQRYRASSRFNRTQDFVNNKMLPEMYELINNYQYRFYGLMVIGKPVIVTGERPNFWHGFITTVP
ncbi:NiFeSe Hases domain containing protein [Asbolus verrucosus]|uniref:NiFeSe Hases domain containing protein n=1 Tax=Asbolus verrucosus TaxID=1661398 RepID=A0A482VHT5_ASBVE|nr:NiFeSe Hases domain containing protein [Asbolus verrucosus]